MTLLSTHDLLLRRDDRDLLRVARLELVAGMRLGVVGANGSGKSTLLAALAGRLAPAEGLVRRPPGIEVALVSQGPAARPGLSLLALAQAELASLDALAQELERVRPHAELGSDVDAGMRYAELIASFDQRGGFTAEARLRRALERVGLDEATVRGAATDASGGERQRARLAGALTGASDVLLLDEPSNHLDLGARVWLAEQLLDRPGALVIASHDRALLDRVCTHVAHVDGGQLVVRRGGYSQVQARLEGEARGRGRRDAARAGRIAELERMAADLARFGHRGAATRRRRAERERATLEAAASVSHPPQHGSAAGDSRPGSPPDAARRPPAAAPTVLLAARHLRVEGVLDDAQLTLRAGQRLAVLGPSGSGKSTLLELLAGVRESDDPRARVPWRPGTSLLYLDQTRRGLADDASALETLAAWVSSAQAAGALAAAGLPRPAWSRPASTLSGGERARVALALLSVRDADVVVLDEPTNDLDLPGIESLEAALVGSRACLVLATHDEALVRALGAEVLAVESGALVAYRGGVDGYRRGAKRLEPGLDAAGPPADDDAAAPASDDADDTLSWEDALRAAQTALEDPLRLSERERARWSARREAAEAALVELADAAFPAPEPRYRTLEAGLGVHADRDGDGLAVRLDEGPGLRVHRVGTLAHLAPSTEDEGAPRSVLPWAWRALCRGAARLAIYLLPVDTVQVSSRVPLEPPLFEPIGDDWWVVRRSVLESAEGWLRHGDRGRAPGGGAGRPRRARSRRRG